MRAYPHSIFYENRLVREPYKFVRGSLEKLKEVMALAFLVCDGIKRDKNTNEKACFSPHATVICGNLGYAPQIKRASQRFINSIGALAIKENAPYTVLDEGCIKTWKHENCGT